MEARATLRPGKKGTKKLVARFGDRLICVRYRYDARRRKRFTTVELIVEEADWTPPDATAQPPAPAPLAPEPAALGAVAAESPAAERAAGKRTAVEPAAAESALVGIKVEMWESAVQRKVKAAGGRWDRARQVWLLPLTRVRALRLVGRIGIATGEKSLCC